ncbi:hypothetical protein [Caballeronia arvi]|uniref:hypothetical protein n=1 Tax=Caballeronia arvi TaxID=1777135 RepID=UPI001F3C25DB|nr:hypothetical protein [Caballeronia arvi]
MVLEIDETITLRRRASAAWLTARGDAVPLLPIRPSRIELAVVIALAETFGASLYKEARFVSVIDLIAEVGAVALVQRVMYGVRPDYDNSDDGAPAVAAENARLAEVLREARVAFEFLCTTWPEVFLAQAHATLAGIGVQVHPPDGRLAAPSSYEDDDDDADSDQGNEDDERDEGGESG